MPLEFSRYKLRNIELYQKEAIEIARKFTSKLYQDVKKSIVMAILFGSSARRTSKPINDIDILLVVDDTTIDWNLQMTEAYRVIVDKNIAEVSPERLHVTTLKLTTFWDYIRNGDPIAINILRDGISLIDIDLFDPLQALLFQGRIRPTVESIYVYYARAPTTLNNARWHLVQATLDLYWAVIDASHAALMTQNVIPPSPEHVSDLISQELIDKGLLDKKYADTMKFFYDLSKKIEHRELSFITGAQFEEHYKKANEYVIEIDNFIAAELSKRKAEQSKA